MKRHLQCRLMSELSPRLLCPPTLRRNLGLAFSWGGAGGARLGRRQQPGSYAKPRWLMDDCYGSREVSANTFSRIATATTCPITSTSFKGRTSICDGESGCGCKMILPSCTAHQQHANPVRISKK